MMCKNIYFRVTCRAMKHGCLSDFIIIGHFSNGLFVKSEFFVDLS